MKSPEDVLRYVLRQHLETIQQESAIQLLNSVHLVGGMIIITVVFINAQVRHHGIHLAIILPNYAQYSAPKDYTLIVTLVQGNVCQYVLVRMTFMEIRQEVMTHLEIIKPTDVNSSV